MQNVRGRRSGRLFAAGLWIAAIATGTTAWGFGLDSSTEARTQPGTHQFYIWCTGTDDFSMTESGPSADAAGEAAYERLRTEGKGTCWPIWQGRLS